MLNFLTRHTTCWKKKDGKWRQIFVCYSTRLHQAIDRYQEIEYRGKQERERGRERHNGRRGWVRQIMNSIMSLLLQQCNLHHVAIHQLLFLLLHLYLLCLLLLCFFSYVFLFQFLLLFSSFFFFLSFIFLYIFHWFCSLVCRAEKIPQWRW